MARLVWRGDRVMDQLQRDFQRRAARAAHVAEQDLRARVSVPFPPAGKRGEPPRRRTGGLARAIKGSWAQVGGSVVVRVALMLPVARVRWTLQEHGALTRGVRRKIMAILRGR